MMFVTAHAHNRAQDRLGPRAAQDITRLLEATRGVEGTVAYIVTQLAGKALASDGSNGELVIAVAVDGSVETLFFRRASQDITPAFFGAREVVDMRMYPLYADGPIDSREMLAANPQKRGAI